MLSNYTEWLLFHLWKHSSQERSNGRHGGVGVLIPHTIVYRWAQPLCWYYSDENGEIRRRKKDTLGIKYIESTMTEAKSKSGVVAVGLYEIPPKHPDPIEDIQLMRARVPGELTERYKTLIPSPDQIKPGEILVEYMTSAEFCRLI
jgi:hypothetical protein